MKRHKEKAKFPLTRNGDRGWYKWLNGQSRYICPSSLTADQAAAYWYANEAVIRQRIAPRPVVTGDALTLAGLVNLYLAEREADMNAGKLSRDYFSTNHDVCKLLLTNMDRTAYVESIRPDHFGQVANKVAKRAASQQRVISRIIRGIFTRAYENEWISKPVRLGRRMKDLSNARVSNRSKPIYTAAECRQILAAIEAKRKHYALSRADLAESYQRLNCLVLLALNGGYGMKELAALRVGDVDPATGVAETDRGKSGAHHRVPLWPETLAAIRPFMARKKKDALIFKTRKGLELTRVKLDGVKAITTDGPGQTFGDLVEELGLKRPGHRFYLLKHTHRSASGGAGDESAADILCGHRLPGMRHVYQQVDVARLRRVTEHVRAWLFTSEPRSP